MDADAETKWEEQRQGLSNAEIAPPQLLSTEKENPYKVKA
jgi:hypothetical protein